MGQGSQRARLVTDRTALQAALAAEPDLLALEYLPGPEYTVDCFATPEQGVLFAAPRLRRQAKAGIAVLTEPAKLPEAWHYAELIHATLPMRGAWFFQLKTAANGQLKILEVAPRIAGSMALSHALGPNLPLLSLYAAAGQKVALDCMPGRVRLARSLDTRFLDPRPFGVLYLDLDDTLLTQNGVNSRMMALIFNCHNRGIPVNLITRHHGDLTTTLQCYRLTGLFTRIIHLVNPDDTKASYINEPDAVLVDDSFSERHAAIQARGIRAYDAAGAACLIDERI